MRRSVVVGIRGRVLTACVVVCLSMASSSCGYALAGRGSFLPDYIETIGIPLFLNYTAIFEIERIVTEKVRSEFIGRGSYAIVPDRTGVDALLDGTISSIIIQPAAFTGEQQASRYVLIMQATITLQDVKTMEVLWSDSVVFREEYEVTSATDAFDTAAFFGSGSNAVERISSDFAETVVSSILEAF